MVTLWCAAASGNGACSLLLHSPLSKDVQWKFHAWRRHRRQIRELKPASETCSAEALIQENHVTSQQSASQ